MSNAIEELKKKPLLIKSKLDELIYDCTLFRIKAGRYREHIIVVPVSSVDVLCNYLKSDCVVLRKKDIEERMENLRDGMLGSSDDMCISPLSRIAELRRLRDGRLK